jgi:hypothetical protein
MLYIDECKWHETEPKLAAEFRHIKAGKLAEIALVDAETKTWRFETFLPERFQLDGKNSLGVVYSSAAAKKVAELILLNTVLTRL